MKQKLPRVWRFGKTAIFYIFTVILPISSLFLIYLPLTKWIERFLNMGVGGSPILIVGKNLLLYDLYFIPTALVISTYIGIAYYEWKEDLDSKEKISYPMVSAFTIILATRFLKYFSSSGLYGNIIEVMTRFAILLPLIASINMLRLIMVKDSSHIEFLISVSEKKFNLSEVLNALLISSSFGAVAYLAEFLIIPRIPDIYFKLIGLILASFSLIVLYSLNSDDFVNWLKNLDTRR